MPTEYPPLFPWLIARVADVAHKPGWELVGDAQALLMSLTVLAGLRIASGGVVGPATATFLYGTLAVGVAGTLVLLLRDAARRRRPDD